jgi:hypothetical protein
VTEMTKCLENRLDHESEGTDDEDTNIELINPGSMIENCDFISFAPGKDMKPFLYRYIYLYIYQYSY